MKKILLGLLAVSCHCFSLPLPEPKLKPAPRVIPVMNKILIMAGLDQDSLQVRHDLQNLALMMQYQGGNNLKPAVINKVITSLECAHHYQIQSTPILTIIDYTLPASEKRLWVFDLEHQKLLFHTYVSHGIKSGFLFTNFFSNKNDSKASSLGIYQTDSAYYGREGLSLRLNGLDYGFNDNAANRYIVMHGGWYVEEAFIKKYGRPGRSWGCPAVPLNLSKAIINTIKDRSMMVVYYPDDNWFGQSRFLNCERLQPAKAKFAVGAEIKPLRQENMQRDAILYADVNANNSREESEAVVALSADNYAKFFHLPAPLTRMLRRQIDNQEYIVLSRAEWLSLLSPGQDQSKNLALQNIAFVIPEVVMVRGGYYETLMKVQPWGHVKTVTDHPESQASTVELDKGKKVVLKPYDRFIRWIGL